MSLGDSIFKSLPYRMQSDIAYGNYMNAEADINRLQGLNQNLASYREALQEAQQAKFTAGEEYLAAINASRKQQGKEAFTGWPEEAMGTRRVMPAVDRMGAPLTPDEEDQYRHTPPRRAYPVSAEEMTQAQGQARDARFMQNAGEMAPASYLETSEEGSVPTNPSRVQFLGGRMEGQPEAPKQPKATKKSDFTQVSNEKQPARQLTPLERYNKHIADGEIGEANELKYNLEKQTFDRNMAKINAAYVQVLNTQGAAEADRFRDGYAKIAKERFQAKPVEETEAFKTAQVYVNRAGFHQNRASVAMLGEELARAKQMMRDPKKSKEDVIQLLSANIPKLVQSLATGQSDAVQEAEARRLMPELTTILNQGVDISAALKVASQKQLMKWFTTQPEDFIKKAEDIFAAAVRVQNQSADQYRKQIGSRAAESILLTKLPEKVEPGGGNELFQYRQRLAAINPSPQQAQMQGQPQPPPVQTQRGTVAPPVTPSSIWPVFTKDSFGP
jgi:hypothetical protein